MGRPQLTLEERFKSRAKPMPSGCIEWVGEKSVYGYGVLREIRLATGSKVFMAHRVAWELTFGAIPKNVLVCHHCDNRSCVNPEHLFLGSHKDNTQDMVHKGRSASGEKHGNVKLTKQQALIIEHSVCTNRTLSERYGISESQIRRIRGGKNWA